ncbi:MAG: hypothetical protein L3J07_02995 [Candidatus Magasanikbacteria bacterium]|nr:hypothetical protein [Candidatus Magasanikbacteria bacterium]
MSDVRDGAVKIVEVEFKDILYTFRSMGSGYCVSFNKKKILSNYNDMILLVNLFSIRFGEIGVTKKEYSDVENFIFSF